MKSYFFCSLNVPLYVKTINIFIFFIYWQFNYFFILEDMFTSWVFLHIRQRNSLVHFFFFFSFKYYLIRGYFKHRKSVNRVYRKDLPIYIYVKIIMYNNTVVYVLSNQFHIKSRYNIDSCTIQFLKYFTVFFSM